MIIAITGHRPERIPNPSRVRDELHMAYKELGVTRVIQGMASGVDLWSAQVAFRMKIPYVCVRPWAGHKPRKADEYDYFMALRHCDETVVVDPSEEYPGPWVYGKRNEWMVDHAESIVAVWDGGGGGTAHCVNYAESQDKQIMVIKP